MSTLLNCYIQVQFVYRDQRLDGSKNTAGSGCRSWPQTFAASTIKTLIMKLPLLSILITFLYASAHAQQDSIREVPITEAAIATLKIEGYPDFLAADGKDVWITNKKKVEKLSLGHSTPVLTVAISQPCGAMVTGFGSLWVANCSDKAIYRFDLKSGNVIASIVTGLASEYGELSLAAGDGSVWVLSDSAGILTRINPQTNTIQATIKVKPFSYCAAFGYGAVWITNCGQIQYHRNGEVTARDPGSVQKIDPKTNQVVATIPVGFAPNFLAAGENGIWILNQVDGSVSRINPDSNQITATIDAKVSGWGGDIAAGAGSVWLRGNKTFFLVTVDPKLNAVSKRYGPLCGSGAVRVADNIVWVSAHDSSTVWAIKK
jgi:virginiamycin B lyase